MGVSWGEGLLLANVHNLRKNRRKNIEISRKLLNNTLRKHIVEEHRNEETNDNECKRGVA